jgi:hypothetical protein
MAFVSLHQSEDKRTQTVFLGESERLVFNSGAHEPATRGVRQSDQMEVEYRLHRPRGQQLDALVRRVKYHIDDRPERGGREEILVEGVRALKIAYFDKQREDWTTEWEVRIDDAQLMRVRLRELQRLREQAEGVGAATAEAAATGATGDPLAAIGTAVAGAAVEASVDLDVAARTQELLDGLVLPSRVRITLELDNDGANNLVMQTQVEIPLTEPLWY